MVYDSTGIVLLLADTRLVNLRLGYRVRQFWGALGWGAKPVEEDVLRTHLNAAQVALFQSMCAAEQRHSLAVLRTLQENGYAGAAPTDGPNGRPQLTGAWVQGHGYRGTSTERPSVSSRNTFPSSAGVGELALTQAALLHDVGKVEGRIRLWHRVSTVLLRTLHPALLHRLALNEPSSWRYPFFVLLHHAERGADLSAAAGADALAVALIRAHHTPAEQSGLDAPGQALLTALCAADGQN